MLKKGSSAWNDAAQNIASGGKSNHVTETATEAKSLLNQGRGNMNRYRNYAKDRAITYKKGYETHNTQNARELGVGNDLQHIKWKDGKSGGHIFYRKPN